MKSKQLIFFTVLEDIENILLYIESTIELQYYKTGLFDNHFCKNYSSIRDIPNVGITFSGDWNRIDNYLILKKSTSLNIREIPQKSGGIKFAVDQLKNLKSIELKVGGIYQTIENVIVAGRIATISEDKDSTELYNLIKTKIKKEYKKIGTFYLGKVAEEKLKLGWRLVTNEKLPTEYDLNMS